MKTILYLGTDPEHFSQGKKDALVIHYPVISIVPRSIDHPDVARAYRDLPSYTHLLFTSKNSVRVFFDHMAILQQQLHDKTLIAIGTVTAKSLSDRLRSPDHIAEEETQEGLIELLQSCALENAYIFLPRSSLSRPVLTAFLEKKNIRYTACDLYDTVAQKTEPIPDLRLIDEIVFTSPSTVHAFLKIFGTLPKDKQLHAIGPITAEVLLNG